MSWKGAGNEREPETWKNDNKTNRVDGAYSNEKLLNLKWTFTFLTLFTHFLHERGEQKLKAIIGIFGPGVLVQPYDDWAHDMRATVAWGRI